MTRTVFGLNGVGAPRTLNPESCTLNPEPLHSGHTKQPNEEDPEPDPLPKTRWPGNLAKGYGKAMATEAGGTRRRLKHVKKKATAVSSAAGHKEYVI